MCLYVILVLTPGEYLPSTPISAASRPFAPEYFGWSNFPRSRENKRWPSPATGCPPKWAALSLRFFTATTIDRVDDCGVTMPHGHRAGLVILTVGDAVGRAGRAN